MLLSIFACVTDAGSTERTLATAMRELYRAQTHGNRRCQDPKQDTAAHIDKPVNAKVEDGENDNCSARTAEPCPALVSRAHGQNGKCYGNSGMQAWEAIIDSRQCPVLCLEIRKDIVGNHQKLDSRVISPNFINRHKEVKWNGYYVDNHNSITDGIEHFFVLHVWYKYRWKQ